MQMKTYKMKKEIVVLYSVIAIIILLLLLVRYLLAVTRYGPFTLDKLDLLQPLFAVIVTFNAVSFVTTKYVLNPGSEILFYRFGKVKDTISLQEKFRVGRTTNSGEIVLEQFKDGAMHQIVINNVKEIDEIYNHLSYVSAQRDKDLGYSFFVYNVNYNVAQKSTLAGILFGALILSSLSVVTVFLLPIWLASVLFVPAFALFATYIQAQSNKIKNNALILYENGMIDYRRGKHKLELNLKNCDLAKSEYIVKSKARYTLELFDGERHVLKLDYFYVDQFVENLQRIHAAVNNIEEQRIQIVSR
jgi:hypothetical protein